ncbi:hypothetical protein LCM4577_14320 [Mesorhizobium sp. LCM 4577]|jgi:hypothetical protein|uniref:Uncharacterized protein n=2 Tax=Mesorhizobium TaxID=68287 RepID=A0A090GAU0_MESPL|nr:hypothetical protein [Mesorhizobium sp. LCM 4577]OHV62662.1 hypothetical protein LCM4577_14320 [Mesorhizobium sp. LCM 4577]OHV63288.1 hypothetical protein LCM4576_04205 [Mesorhizobium sp. LCM 4576]CDX61181.1 hypothetical protein MPL3365_60029 [Mesorhizobium plurifarium]
MVEIISKRDGSRREDVAMKRLIEQNRATITRLADHISGGSYSAGKAPKPKRRQKASSSIPSAAQGPPSKQAPVSASASTGG